MSGRGALIRQLNELAKVSNSSGIGSTLDSSTSQNKESSSHDTNSDNSNNLPPRISGRGQLLKMLVASREAQSSATPSIVSYIVLFKPNRHIF